MGGGRRGVVGYERDYADENRRLVRFFGPLHRRGVVRERSVAPETGHYTPTVADQQ